MAARAQDIEFVELDRQLLELLSERVRRWRERVVDGTVDTTSHASVESLAAAHAGGNVEVRQATAFLRHVDSICRRQAGLREPIVFLGPIYSYSYLAAVEYFGLAADLVPVTTIPAAFDEILRGQAKYGVVPIENSTDGRVVDTLGMFARTPVQIVGEVLLPIHHCLLGRCSRAEVTTVQSKPQALSQCRGWLAQHVPDAELVEVASTATAAALAAQTPGAAAIASAEAGLHYGLQIIDENIEDNSQNVTRFAIIGQPCEQPGQIPETIHSRAHKTSLMFQLHHRPGALARAMVAFEQANVNLTWIESFPLPDHPNEYLFFVELEGHCSQARVAQAIEQLRQDTQRLEVLGSYPRGKVL